MRKKIYIVFGVLLFIIVGLMFWSDRSNKDNKNPSTVLAKRGEFLVELTVTGEFEAGQSTLIEVDPIFNKLKSHFYKIKINNIIAEGSLVDSGAWIATLDQTAINEKRNKIMERIENYKLEIEKTVLDTTVSLSEKRNTLLEMSYNLEDKEFVIKQSKYESPAKQRQAQIDFNKTQRALEQEKIAYNLELKKAEKKLRRRMARVKRIQKDLDLLDEFKMKSNITAPKKGMVIYAKNWNGKIKAGSQLYQGYQTVATLPDLSILKTKSYVNEIDIRKLKVGQTTIVTPDAFPNKKLNSKISEI